MKLETTATWLLAVAAFLLLVATEPFYREALFNASIPTIIALQSTATPWSINFFKVISDVGAFGIMFGVILGSFVWLERNKAFYFLTYYGEILFIMGMGKMAYHSPRPYMVSDDV